MARERVMSIKSKDNPVNERNESEGGRGGNCDQAWISPEGDFALVTGDGELLAVGVHPFRRRELISEVHATVALAQEMDEDGTGSVRVE